MMFQRGFTLLELLIGLALLGFMLALLFGGFRIASTAWNAVETRIERSSHEDMAKAFMRRIIAQLQPMRWKSAVGSPITFRGDPDQITTVASLTGQSGSSGIRLIALAVEPDPQIHAGTGRVRLVIREAPLRREVEDFSEPLLDAKTHLILDDLAEVRFDYFGAEKKGGVPTWQETWPNIEELPRLIRIRLLPSTGDLMELVAAPMISASRCNWDAFYKRCR